MKLNKITNTLLAVVMAGVLLTGCSGSSSGEAKVSAGSVGSGQEENVEANEAANEEKGTEEKKEDTSENENISFRYIINNIGNVHTIDIALKKGFFEEAGIDVETVGIADGGVGTIESIVSGSADIGYGGIPAYINAVLGGSPIKVFYGGPSIANKGDPAYRLIVRKDSGIKSAADLKGKNIGVAALGAWYEYFVRLYLAEADLTVDDVNLVTIPGSEHQQALLSNQIDASVDWTPIADAMLEDEQLTAVTTLYDVLGEEYCSNGWGSITNSKTLAERPEDYKRLTKVLVETDEWIEANPDEAKKVVQEVYEEREQSEIYYKYWKPFHLVNHGMWDDSTVQFFIDYMGEIGQIDPSGIRTTDIYTNETNPFFEK